MFPSTPAFTNIGALCFFTDLHKHIHCNPMVVASWLVHLSLERAVWVQALARDTAPVFSSGMFNLVNYDLSKWCKIKSLQANLGLSTVESISHGLAPMVTEEKQMLSQHFSSKCSRSKIIAEVKGQCTMYTYTTAEEDYEEPIAS